MLMDDPHLYLNPAKYFQTAPCVWMRTCWCSWFLTLDHSRGGCPSVWSKSRLGSYLEFILRCSAVTRGSTPGLLKFTWEEWGASNQHSSHLHSLVISPGFHGKPQQSSWIYPLTCLHQLQQFWGFKDMIIMAGPKTIIWNDINMNSCGSAVS